MKIGVLGAGSIARVVARTMARMDEVETYAVAARSIERAEEFARELGFSKAYGSYEEMVKDPEVDLVYIATPHSHHAAHMKLCVEHGKAVLCEKAFCVNAKEAREVMELAKKKGVLVTEAIWPRYMPSRRIVDDLLKRGVIGKVSTMTANLSYPVSHVERLKRPELAGGALLDITVYAINYAIMHLGTEIERIESSVQMSETGVDEKESITIFYKNGSMAVLTGGMTARSDRKAVFYGDKGYMIVENINNPGRIEIYDTADRLLETVPVPEQISGYEYELQECVDCLKEGRTESVSMPLEDSVYMMSVMDEIRRQWGLVYPMEKSVEE